MSGWCWAQNDKVKTNQLLLRNSAHKDGVDMFVLPHKANLDKRACIQHNLGHAMGCLDERIAACAYLDLDQSASAPPFE